MHCFHVPVQADNISEEEYLEWLLTPKKQIK
jgi:hypothetical protein